MTVKVTTFINAAVQQNNPNEAGDAGAAGATTRIGGISESFYVNGTYNSNELFDLMDAYCTLRVKLLPNVCAIVGTRLQEVGARAKTLVRRKSYSGTADTIGDIPQMALRLNAHSRTSGAERAIVLGAIPDARVNRGTYNPSLVFQNNLNAYCQFVQNNFLMRATVQTVPTFAIAGISDVGLVTTVNDTLFEEGNVVQILSSRDSKYRARGGYFKIISKPTAKTFLLEKWDFGPCVDGKVRLRETAFEQVDVYASDRTNPIATTRKFGRPFNLYRGRA